MATRKPPAKPRRPSALPVGKAVSKKLACDHLDICTRTFDRAWADVFTDPRDPADRARGKRRKVLLDELRVAVERGRAAVYAHRKLFGRLRD